MSEPIVKERRNTCRRNLMYYVSVFELDTSEYVGLIVDLSESGMLLTGVERLEPGRVYHFGLVDVLEANAPEQISFGAVACWSKRASATFYDTGFEFLQLGNKAKQRFDSYE